MANPRTNCAAGKALPLGRCNTSRHNAPWPQATITPLSSTDNTVPGSPTGALRTLACQIFTGVAVVTATALLIDGIVVAWFPAVYGGALPQVTNCAAAILWGAGVGLVLAFMLNKGANK